jgi:inosine-uridine nucleoside N-ribohydrolase
LKQIIIDCDGGHDDAIALMLALSSTEELDVIAVTTVAGTVSEPQSNRNARKILDVGGRGDIPVHAGCDRPLVQPHVPYFSDDDGLRGVALPEPLAQTADLHAVDAIVETVRSDEPGTVTLCALGPLTNVAVALAKAPDISERLAGIALMGGAAGLGNATAAAEFNVLTDPHAASRVFASGATITMFGLELCYRAVVHDDWVRRLAGLGTPAAHLSAEFLRRYGAALDGERFRVFGLPIYDACVIGWLLAPELFAGRRHRVDVELEGQFCQGRTVVDLEGRTGDTPNATVMSDVDVGAFRELLITRLGSVRSMDAGRAGV